MKTEESKIMKEKDNSVEITLIEIRFNELKERYMFKQGYLKELKRKFGEIKKRYIFRCLFSFSLYLIFLLLTLYLEDFSEGMPWEASFMWNSTVVGIPAKIRIVAFILSVFYLIKLLSHTHTHGKISLVFFTINESDNLLSIINRNKYELEMIQSEIEELKFQYKNLS